MKTIFYTIVIMFIITKAYGQDNYLNPCFDYGYLIPQIDQYNKDLEKTINSKLEQDFMIRFIAEPAFSPEYVFQIEEESQNYVIKTIILGENLWNSKDKDSIELYYYETTMDSLVATNLTRLFDKITSSAMNRNEKIGSGSDGVTYLFYKSNEIGTKNCGECWSPSKGTILFELVSICNSLFDLTKEANYDYQDINNRIDLVYDQIE